MGNDVLDMADGSLSTILALAFLLGAVFLAARAFLTLVRPVKIPASAESELPLDPEPPPPPEPEIVLEGKISYHPGSPTLKPSDITELLRKQRGLVCLKSTIHPVMEGKK